MNWALTLWDICTLDVSAPEGSTGPEGQQVQFAHEFRLEVIYVSAITGVCVCDITNEGDLEGNSLQHLLCEEVKAFAGVQQFSFGTLDQGMCYRRSRRSIKRHHSLS